MRTAWGKLIEENRKEILDRWIEKEFTVFSEKMGRATPIGEALLEGLSMMLDEIEENSKRFMTAVNQVARLLAVQPVPPSRALMLFFDLKTILHDVAPKAGNKSALRDADWESCQKRIEQITLVAFDCYMANREKIYQLKVEESKRQAFMLLRRAQP